MTTSKQMIKALAYMDNDVNIVYRLAEHRANIRELKEDDIDAIVKSIKTICNNFEYMISDRYPEEDWRP